MKRTIFIWTALLGLLMCQCGEAPFGQTPTDNVPPQPLSNVQVEAAPGGAKITYELPANETDLSYVKGEYLFQGKKKTIRSSIYKNYLVVEGLGSVEPVEITLYTVDHSENVSTPVKKSFVPDTPPIQTIFETLAMYADFGGVNCQWDNPLGLEIGVTLYIDSLGKWDDGQFYYTAMKEGNHSFRNLQAKEMKFGAQLTDKWGNTTGIKDIILTPMFEKMLDKTKFRVPNPRIPKDAPFDYLWECAWDCR
jgi:hypothetical protein